MTQYGVTEPRAMRTTIYGDMMADTQVIRDNRSTHTIDLLRIANETSCNTAVATMSQRTEAIHVLRSLELEQTLDLILTREDVKNSKPDPEIYLMAARKLSVLPRRVPCSGGLTRRSPHRSGRVNKRHSHRHTFHHHRLSLKPDETTPRSSRSHRN
jgi:hypothetical protein